MAKIKIFLGGFINYTNAQNLNCLALAKYLDKNSFAVYTLERTDGNLESQKNKILGVNIFRCKKPYRFSTIIGYVWGIWHCEVAYLPKSELWKLNRFLLWLFNKKSFSTQEGILDIENTKSSIASIGTYDNLIASKTFTTKNFAITPYLGKYNLQYHQIKTENKVLYLGCDSTNFLQNIIREGTLNSIVYIGRLKERKGIYDFIKIAQQFPQLKCYVFGHGEEEENIKKIVIDQQISNLFLKGVASHNELASFLAEVDVHILPSRSEGFPKVILETAAAGVPSIVYGDYGANEWIKHEENGWVVNNLEEIKLIIDNLLNQPQKLKGVSLKAIQLAQTFDWQNIISDWESEIKKIANNK